MNDYLNLTLLTVHYAPLWSLQRVNQTLILQMHSDSETVDQLRSWLYEVISFPILEPKTVILRLPSETTSNYILINHIILLFKHFIFLKRKERNHIGFNGLKAFIKNVENTENQITSHKQKADIHYKKWNPVLPLM